MKLLEPYRFQGYEVYFDNFYTSPALLDDLVKYEILATGTLNVTRKEVPSEVAAMKHYLDKQPRGSGYYFREKNFNITFCVWHDTKTVTLASTVYPAHSNNTVVRRVKDPVTQASVTTNVPCPVMLEKYNQFMGGVDKSDQLISYHKISRKTVKYWKTTFYHLIDLAIVNAHNWCQLQISEKPVTENQFRDALVLKIISNYGTGTRPQDNFGRPATSCNIRHGSKLYPLEKKSRCVYCHLHNAKNYTQRKCPDCLLTPALCQTLKRDCHSCWHSKSFTNIRKLWYEHWQTSNLESTPSCSSHGRGRPKGSINQRKCRGNYHNH